MGILPPDPGKALSLAKISTYNDKHSCFERTGDLRWLYPESNAWNATARAERTVSRTTYLLLRSGVPTTDGTNRFEVPGASGEPSSFYALLDNGYEAYVEPA